MTEVATEWLLDSDEPAVRYLTRRDVLGQDADDDSADILNGPRVRALLSGQQADGGFGQDPYAKWQGAFWRLISLVELEAPASDPRVMAVCNRVLDWLTDALRRSRIRPNPRDGLVRRHAFIEGSAIAAACRLGLAGDARVEQLARLLVEWQWPDGGWNCDVRAKGHRSSFHESLAPTWGLHEYGRATDARWAKAATKRAAHLFLSHRLYKSPSRNWEVINPEWTLLRYPPYWHYDVLQGLLIMTRLAYSHDRRMKDALDLIEQCRHEDGRWRPSGYWWKPVGSRAKGGKEAVDWGREGPSEMVTLNALRVLHAAGRL